MRQIRTLADVQQLARDVEDLRSKLETRNTDMHGRRITGAGRSKDLDDYVTRREVLGGISGTDSSAIHRLENKTESKINPGPGDVTISTGAIVGQYYWDANDNTQKIKVTIPWIAPGTSEFRDFALLRTAVETPFKDAANPLDPTNGFYKVFTDQNVNMAPGGSNTSIFIMPAPSRNEYWRFYFATGKVDDTPEIIREPATDATNSVTVAITASSTVLNSDYSGNVNLTSVGSLHPSLEIVDGTLTMNFDKTNGLRIINSTYSEFTQIYGGYVYSQLINNANRWASFNYYGVSVADVTAGNYFYLNPTEGLKHNSLVLLDLSDNLNVSAVKVNGTKVVGTQQSAIALPSYGISGTADLTYDAVERDMINAIKTDISTLGGKIDAIIVALRTHGLIAT